MYSFDTLSILETRIQIRSFQFGCKLAFSKFFKYAESSQQGDIFILSIHFDNNQKDIFCLHDS